MGSPTPRGKVNLQLWSDGTALREPAKKAGFVAKFIHDKGAPVKLANGQNRASKATRHYLASEIVAVDGPHEANQRIGEILSSLRGTELSQMIASGDVEAEISLTAFHGNVEWEAQLDPALNEAVRAANVRLFIEHYDKFDEKGAPLAVRL